MFNNPYMPNYNQQTQYANNIDQNYLNMLDKEEEKIKNMKNNYMNRYQTPAINQTFQLAPTSRDVIKYADSINEVQKDMVIGETPYFSKDMSIVWIKNGKGEIKTYELTEIIPKDEKDMQIEFLQSQIEELRKEMNKYDGNAKNVVTTKNEPDTQWNDEPIRTTTKNEKSTSISTVSTSKKK